MMMILKPALVVIETDIYLLQISFIDIDGNQ